MNKELEVIILMGIPGSGKSTFADKLSETHLRICQDVLGNRNDCINWMKRALSQGHSITLDRTNISRGQRQYFIDVAKDFGAKVYCVFLDTPVEICIERVKNRKDHETITADLPEEKKIEIVAKFNKSLELPQYSEGINEIFHITNSSNDGNAFTEFLEQRKSTETA